MLDQTTRSLARALAICCCSLLMTLNTAIASPWIDAGDERARHHLQVLADSGRVNLPLTTWPLMRADVEKAIATIDPVSLTDAERRSLDEVRQIIRGDSGKVKFSQSLYANSTMPGFVDFSSDFRERLESRTTIEAEHGRWAGRARLSVVGQDIDGQTWRGDGSFVSGQFGNWQLGFGAVDQWWGPGWQSSIILSDAARPAAGFFVNRVASKPFQLPVLRWFGPWTMRVFANELESDRPSANAKLLGFRTSFKPHPKVELGLSRTAQWGGEGRPEDWRSLRKTIFGQSNVGHDGLAEDGSDEPANQLAGYDWRVSHTVHGLPSAFYGQIIGEDEAHSQPYKFLALIGLETVIYSGAAQHRFMFEASNTTMEFYKYKGGTPNVGYESQTHPAGYRHRGRPIGASTDNDTENYLFKGVHDFGNHGIHWTFGRAIVNADGTGRAAPGGNPYTQTRIDTWHAAVTWQYSLNEKQRIEIGGQYFENSLQLRDQEVGTGLHAAWHFQF